MMSGGPGVLGFLDVQECCQKIEQRGDKCLASKPIEKCTSVAEMWKFCLEGWLLERQLHQGFASQSSTVLL